MIIRLLITLLIINNLNASTKLSLAQNDLINKQTLERIHSWQELIKTSQNKKLLSKLKIVNDYFNKLKYKSDINNWKKNDYWATPSEFLFSGAGDCEDYAIAKYFTLKKLGIKEEKLKLVYAKLVKNDQAHIVLSYSHKPNNVPIILDNINKKLKLSSNRKDLKQMRDIQSQTILNKFKLQTFYN